MVKTIFFLILFLFVSLFVFPQPPEKYTRDWGTYIGGPDLDWGFMDSKVDANDNIWVAGTVNTDVFNNYFDNLITQDAHQSTGAGGRDIFIVKFSPMGDLLYATYYGGEGIETFYGLDVKGDKVYVAGVTSSTTGISTPGSLQEMLEPTIDPNGNPYTPRAAFLAQFDTLGVLQWSTYFQGNGVIMSNAFGDVKAGNDDDIYLWTQTNSSNLGTAGAFKETIPSPYMNSAGDYVAPYYPLLARFDDSGQLLWATYYGPDITSESDPVEIPDGGLAVDFFNNVYVSGRTNSLFYYGTIGSHQSANGGGLDIFFSKFSPSGQREWSTYYGGMGNELFPKIHISTYDSFYLTGVTTSTNAITTPNVYRDNFSAARATFVAKFGLNGQRLWGTYCSEDSLIITSVDEDQYGNVFVCNVAADIGNTLEDFPTDGSWQETLGGDVDIFIMKLNSLGADLEWGTYYGGEERELNGNLIVSEDDEIILLGSSKSNNNIASSGAFQTSLQGQENLFLTKFIPCPPPTLPVAPSPQEYGFGMTLDDLEVEFIEWTGSDLIITWYADEDGTIELPHGTNLENGDTYYVSQQIQGCNESALVAVTVIACTPPAPPVGNETQGFALGDTLENLDVTGSNLTWYADEDRTIILPADTELQDGETYYVSQNVDGCESGLLAVTVVAGLGIKIVGLNNISLYPNPNKGSFKINGLPMNTATLTLFDLQGRTIHSEFTESANQLLELKQGVGTGVYLLQIKVEQESKIFKVIVE